MYQHVHKPNIVPLLEAMHYGLPIVASNIDGMAEILPQEWLFQAGNERELAAAMQRVQSMNNTDFIKINRLRVRRDFNIEKFGEKFYEVLIDGKFIENIPSY